MAQGVVDVRAVGIEERAASELPLPPRKVAVTKVRRGAARPWGAMGAVGGVEANSLLVSQAVRRAQAGDREALGFLYARYADNIYGYVRSIVHSHHEAEDITQHVFAKMMRVIDKYEERDVPFFAWALRVARNVAMDHIRGDRLVPVEEVRRASHVESDPAAGGTIEGLREALSVLPSAQREVLLLRHVAGLSPVEIAKLTGKSEGSIHGLHHRGRRTLAAELASRGMAPTTMAPSRGVA
jgi:RNA polymerase sigma-70 factor, ECF subfamily